MAGLSSGRTMYLCDRKKNGRSHDRWIFNFSDKEQKDYKLTIKGHHTRRTLLHTEWEQYGGTMKKRKENIHLKKKGKDSELTITLPRYSGVLLKLTKKE